MTRAKLESRLADTVFSFRATRTMFRPYQFKPVLKLLETGRARILIADEVGLGKTIEAGLIWTELEARHEANTVLVVCPSHLVGKWEGEMEDRFGFQLRRLVKAGLGVFLERLRQGRLPQRKAYVVSLETLRSWKGLDDLQETPPLFDLVIVDEAHNMRNQNTKNYRLGLQLTEWASSLVFLTATPINLRREDLLSLLRLLAPEDFDLAEDLERRLEPNAVLNSVARALAGTDVSGPKLKQQLTEGLNAAFLGNELTQRPDFAELGALLDKPSLSPRDVVRARRLLAGMSTLSTVITRTRKKDVSTDKAVREELRSTVRWTEPETRFYNEYFAWCDARAKVLDVPLYFAMQMPLRLASASLPVAADAVLQAARADELENEEDQWGLGDADWDMLTDAQRKRLDDGVRARSAVPPHGDLVVAAAALREVADTKFGLLESALGDLNRRGKQAIIFTHFRATLAYLSRQLGRRFRVVVMHGGVTWDERRRIMAGFRRGDYDFLLANQVASEGLDFEFCSAVVNYDL
ncbi:MAG: DEAD/DEAH box helicase, partial [Bifidobacteriaceae bacterium]|nr:DEAD/DEAH box helicase [Bifidobacteriaceae bacterium]